MAKWFAAERPISDQPGNRIRQTRKRSLPTRPWRMHQDQKSRLKEIFGVATAVTLYLAKSIGRKQAIWRRTAHRSESAGLNLRRRVAGTWRIP
jgi:hypothetical protein